MSDINLSGYSNTIELQEVDVSTLKIGHVIMLCDGNGDYVAVEISDFNAVGTIFVTECDSGTVHSLHRTGCLSDEFNILTKKMLLGCFINGKLHQIVMYQV